jgi:hypothetical protein
VNEISCRHEKAGELAAGILRERQQLEYNSDSYRAHFQGFKSVPAGTLFSFPIGLAEGQPAAGDSGASSVIGLYRCHHGISEKYNSLPTGPVSKISAEVIMTWVKKITMREDGCEVKTIDQFLFEFCGSTFELYLL